MVVGISCIVRNDVGEKWDFGTLAKGKGDCMKKCMIMFALAVLSVCMSEHVKTSREPIAELSVKTDRKTEKNQSGAMLSSVEWETAYQDKLDELYEQNGGRYYSVRDLDANGIPELIIKKGTELTIYSYMQGVKLIDSYDFLTGTTVLLVSDHPSYPGILYFCVGGGLEHYGYLSFVEQWIHTEELWNEDFTGITEELGYDRGRILEISKDPVLIEESKQAYQEKKELPFRRIGPDNALDFPEREESE